MLIRYKSVNGKAKIEAYVYSQKEHGVSPNKIEPEVLKILDKLQQNNYEVYLVGGAVRDLLLGREPKDFDIATNASPSKIRRIFKNSRIIGRRFMLVHVYGKKRVYEVSTFRSGSSGSVGNEYGTIEEDAYRRDFTINALYFEIFSGKIIDYVGGYEDIKNKILRSPINLDRLFIEDPVRMIRCVKYAAITGFAIPRKLKVLLKKEAYLLAEASRSRLTEEFLKILASGFSSPIFKMLWYYRILPHIHPEANTFIESSAKICKHFLLLLQQLDTHIRSDPECKQPAFLLSSYLQLYLQPLILESSASDYELHTEIRKEARSYLGKLCPCRSDLEEAIEILLQPRKNIHKA